jgi:biopolymer transport protein ExbB/TolQ
MYAIALALALGLSVGIERVWMLWFSWSIDQAAVLQGIDGDESFDLEGTVKDTPLRSIVEAGTSAQSAEQAWDAMGSAGVLVEARIRDRIPYLMMVGNVATMVGLLGTVYGLIMAFSGLDDASAVERSARLSEGIATAMATTAWGLMVGIPAIAAHAVVQRRAQQTLAFYEAVAGRIAASKR